MLAFFFSHFRPDLLVFRSNLILPRELQILFSRSAIVWDAIAQPIKG